MAVDTGLWYTLPKYEDVVKAIQKDYKVKLPERTALQFWDSCALSQYKEQVAELQAGEEARLITTAWRRRCIRPRRSKG